MQNSTKAEKAGIPDWKKRLRKVFGFRSQQPWKSIVAVLYYVACVAVFVIGMITPPLIPAGLFDTVVTKISTTVIFLWMISPAIFLSETPMRSKLPFFKQYNASKSVVGLMIVFLIFTYLFAMVESWHSPEYKEAFFAYLDTTYAQFVEMGSGNV